MLTIIEIGWCHQAALFPSPNYDNRSAGTAVNLIVIHNISLPPGQYGGSFITDFFLNRLDFNAHSYFDRLRTLRVSAHFLVRRDGGLFQFVSTNDRAWHAGESNFQGRTQCNDFSVGIEMEGSDDEPLADSQYGVLAELTVALCLRHPITAITGHQQIAPGRKTDPGPYFDWRRYEQEVLSIRELSLSFPKGFL
jgi:AmpD protein